LDEIKQNPAIIALAVTASVATYYTTSYCQCFNIENKKRNLYKDMTEDLPEDVKDFLELERNPNISDLKELTHLWLSLGQMT
jgi:hypothetical protein